jgi:hypothetical protein
VAAIYFTLSTLLTWPLLFNLRTTLFGDYADARGEVWALWAKLSGYFDGPTSSLTAAPFGDPTDLGFSQPITEWLHFILAKLFNEVVSYNLVVLLAFPLTAFSTYLLINYLLKNKWAAFLGGLQFGFAPAAVMQASGGHSSLATNFFIPAFLLALFYNRQQRSIRSAFLVGLSYALIVFTAMYVGYFALFIILFFLSIDLWKNQNQRKKILSNAAQGAGFAVLLVLPFVYQRVIGQVAPAEASSAIASSWRDFRELEIYSANPLEYLIPSIDHPIFGRFVYSFVKDHLHGSNVPEMTLYLGILPILLMCLGIYFLVKNKLHKTNRYYFLFFSFAAFFSFLMSLPPVIKFGHLSIPNFSSLAYQIAPMFRVYSRFGIIVNLFVALAVAVVVAELSTKIQKPKLQKVFTMFALILAFEYWSVPPNYADKVDTPPEYATWLANQPGDFIIAEYPMMRWEDLSFYTYRFWQRIHQKRMVNGAANFNPKAWEFYQKVNRLDNPETLMLLRSVGVKYIVVHKKVYREGPVPDPIKRYFPKDYESITYNNGQIEVPKGLRLHFSSETELIFAL